MKYLVYAEFYGSKKKISVVAESAAKARKVVADKIIFHKIVKEEEPKVYDPNDALNQLKDIFGMFDRGVK